MSSPDLRLDWCSHEAAKFACEHWHYTGKVPSGKLVRVGVWEGGKFIGCVLFSSSACPWLGEIVKISQLEVCELVRVALAKHSTPVTRIVSIAIKLLTKQSPGLRMIVSYADPGKGHHGGIYQGGNWIYVGSSAKVWTANGLHNRTFGGNSKRAIAELGPSVRFEFHDGKHKYLYPLDAEIRALVEPMRKTPPRGRSKDGVAPDVQSGEGGSTPTRPLREAREGKG